jgi:dCMP deaminase
MSPCRECSKLIHQSGIKRVVYLNKYKDITGVEFLKRAQVETTHFDKKKLN